MRVLIPTAKKVRMDAGLGEIPWRFPQGPA
jgi:hypothetical protein